MPIDTAAKRSSAVAVGCPWRGRLPFPDGAVGQGDRQAVPFLYSGILAAGVVEPVVGGRWSAGQGQAWGWPAGDQSQWGWKRGQTGEWGWRQGQDGEWGWKRGQGSEWGWKQGQGTGG